MTDDFDDQTPLPTAVRDSTLDMSADLPAIPLVITEAAEDGSAPPANLAAPESLPEDEDERPHHVQPIAPFLVWGTIALIVGGVVAIGTLIGSGLAIPIVAPGFAVMLVGLGSMVYGALRYPWRDDDADVFLDAGALLREHGALPALAVLTLVMMYIYANCFRGELVGDDLSFHMAEARRIADCLSVGDLDLWNPSANGGFASAYYYQVIPHLASALPAAVFGHFVFFFQLSVFLPLVLEPAAAYRGMRLLGATPWQALIAACVIGFMNGESRWGHGNAGTFQVGLYTQTWALAVFPLALGHAVRWITSGTGLASATAWSGLVFLCHPFVGIGLGFTLAIGVLWKLVGRGVDALFRILSHGSRTEPLDTDGPIGRMFTAAARRWQHPTPRGPIGPELWRISLLGVTFAIATIPLVAPFVVDKAGFGGFPHRVPDEVGPGFGTLAAWWVKGGILDHGSPIAILTWAMPLVLLLARAPWLRWLWWPALAFALLLGLGPHLGTTQNDLFPAVRFLGTMQAALALAIGAGAVVIGQHIWRAPIGSPIAWFARVTLGLFLAAASTAFALYAHDAPAGASVLNIVDAITFQQADLGTQQLVATIAVIVLGFGAAIYTLTAMRTRYALRTGYAALAAALGTFVIIFGASALKSRVWVLPQYTNNYRAELLMISAQLQGQPEGRKQVATGADNHWWNLLTYVYGRRPATVQYGGGGLQASPNYDFLWNNGHEYARLAYVYNAPYLVYPRTAAETMPAGDTFFRSSHYEVRRLHASNVISPITITGMLPGGEVGAGTKTRIAALAWLKSEEPLKDHHLAYEGSGPPGPEGDGQVIRAWHQDSPGDAADIVAQVECTRPSTFVARESWHPRWHAYIDGEEATVRRVTPDFPAVDVPPGKHTISFRFERPWWAIGAWLLYPGVVIVAWYVGRRRRRRVAIPTARVV